MRLIEVFIMVGGFFSCLYIAWHFNRLPGIFGLKEKKKWLPWAVTLPLCTVLWFFSFVKYTYAMAFSLYLISFFLVSDIVWLIIKKKKNGVNSRFGIWWARCTYNGILLIILSFLIMLAGALNADNIRVTDYSVSIDKSVGERSLRIAMVADMHLGTGVYSGDLETFDDEINALNPDVVCFVGDIFDERSTESEMKAFEEALKNINPKYGKYYVYGNHDLGKYNVKKTWSKEDIDSTLTNGGVTILKDEAVLVDNDFYIVGRKDYSMTAVPEKEEPRKAIKDLTEGLNKDFPIILLDHRPNGIEEAKEAGVDLQFAGHTHAGQLAPAKIIEKYLLHQSEISYGYKKSGSHNIIVTSGYGTWGMPVRVGSPSEIVLINLSMSQGPEQ